jgi:RNA-directed DNA polymerase
MGATLASDAVINQVYQWLCQQRHHWSANADVWELRRHWHTEKYNIQQVFIFVLLC